jgi:hypothetical protein
MTTPNAPDDLVPADKVSTVDGESITFKTLEEYRAFEAGFCWGEKYGTEKDWGDYRVDDLVDVAFDEASLTVTSRLAAPGPEEP